MDMDGALDMSGGMMTMMIVFMALVIASLAIGVVWLVRRLGPASSHERSALELEHGAAREILRTKYAAGEITEDDYFRRMSGLDQA